MVDLSFMRRFTFIDEVSCRSNETTLLDCPHYKRGSYDYWCSYGGGAGVSCLLQVKNVTAATVQTLYNNYTMQSILLSWELVQ